MNGMEMLLQSFGVNPEEIKQNAQAAYDQVRLMNEQLAHLKESVDRIEAKQGQQAGSLATIQAKTTDIEAQLILMNEWHRREEWPPQVTQSLDELQEITSHGRRTERAAEGINGRRTDADRG